MSRDDRTFLGLGAFGVAIAALCVALFGLRDTGSESASSTADGGGAVAATVTTIDVGLSEFAISPNMANIPTGAVKLNVTNNGTMVHNLSLPSLGLKTPDLNPGETYTLNLGQVAAGDMDMLCEIPGHSASGMTGVLHAGDAVDTGSGESGGATATTMSWQEMDKMMLEVANKFPAKTEGKGGYTLEPTVLDDGTKEFTISADEVDWEVAPGKFVKAMGYNGVVPGPEIHVSDGDKVRIVFTNNLTNQSTDLHFHGIRVPNQMDGVDPYTQAPVEPGQTFVYEFTAKGPAVGIYHSHHNAQEQIPNGLFAGFFIDEMPLPQYMIDKGYTQIDKKVTMVLNDAGTIGLSLNGKSFPATEAYTLRIGQVMEVTYMNEGLLGHPMHLHQPVGWIIAKDGVPLDQPLPGDTIWIAPGERYTVLYKATDIGTWAWHCHILNHAEGPTGMFGMVTALIVER